MSHFRSLRIAIPLGVFIVFFGIVLISLYSSLSQREDTMWQEVIERGEGNVARIARHAERFLQTDPQVLEEDLTQLATDPTLQLAMVVEADGTIRFANRFAWRNLAATQVLSQEDKALLLEASRTREAMVQKRPDAHQAIFMMSYAVTDTEHRLRSLDRGVIVLAYDLSATRSQARRDAIAERLLDVAALVLTALILVWVLHVSVTRPLARLQRATQAVSAGNFQVVLKQRGAEEILALTHAFNGMASQMAEQVDALSEQGQKTQAILDNVIDGIITINAQGKVTSFNQAAERIFGHPAETVLGRNVNMLMPEPYHSAHDGYIRHYLNSGEARIIGIGREVTGLRQDGSSFPMELAVSEIQHEGESVFIGMVRDITERKRMDRMKSEFVSTVSHELRTPLTAIRGALGLMAGGALGALPDPARDLVDTAYRNSERLTLLINDLLDMEKIAAGQMRFDIQPQPVMPLVEQAIQANQAYADQFRVRLQLAQRLDEAWINVDSQRFQQVLSNFLSNAVKFSPPDSEVTVRVERIDNRVRVAVADRGPGIPDDFRDRIFQKFSQADASDTRAKGGTGLGLAITKELAEHMGGSVGFESAPGQGALFYCSFPQWHTTKVIGGENQDG